MEGDLLLIGWFYWNKQEKNVSLFPSNGGRNDIVHHPRPKSSLVPAGWTLTWIFDSFFTKSEKSSNHFFKNLRILNKDQRFKSKGMKNPREERKNLGEWKNPARWKTPREISNVWKKLFEAKKSVFHTGMVIVICTNLWDCCLSVNYHVFGYGAVSTAMYICIISA